MKFGRTVGAVVLVAVGANSVLKINPAMKSAEVFGGPILPASGGASEVSGKWSGGILGGDGCIYGIPYNANKVLLIDPAAETATRFGIDLGYNGKMWSGGVLGRRRFHL